MGLVGEKWSKQWRPGWPISTHTFKMFLLINIVCEIIHKVNYYIGCDSRTGGWHIIKSTPWKINRCGYWYALKSSSSELCLSIYLVLSLPRFLPSPCSYEFERHILTWVQRGTKSLPTPIRSPELPDLNWFFYCYLLLLYYPRMPSRRSRTVRAIRVAFPSSCLVQSRCSSGADGVLQHGNNGQNGHPL